MKLKIKKKDKVIVISGRDKGKTGEVLRVIHGEVPRVLVSKVNMVTKHRKPKGTEPGGLQKLEAPIAYSKVMLVDPKTDKPTRVRIEKASNGDAYRVAVGSGEKIL
jgi:large subunit ribosomal protein L24